MSNKPKKLWVKNSAQNTDYYHLASGATESKIIAKADLTAEEITKIISEKGYLGRDWGKYLEVCFPSKNWPKETVDLPAGSYTLKPSDDKPTRLEVMNIREDNYIPLDDHSSLVNDIGRFLATKDTVFGPLNFPYRRGYLFYGEPGTGKTAFIRHLIKNPLLKDAHVIWLNFVPPTSMINALNSTSNLKILVMEELLQENGMLGYEMKELLQFLDGELSIKNSIAIGTTNYPQFLHKNLADRPSRFDVLYEMKAQPPAVIKSILENWLQRSVSADEIDIKNFSVAQLKEICLLHKFYDISLKEAAQRLTAQSKKFESNFVDKKQFGLGFGSED
jgi:SpoVK/Ycf46/Vps4 family AAA+-type ATPase